MITSSSNPVRTGLTPEFQSSGSVTSDPPRKKRKPRPQLSCTECRRLKMKCDRNVPCGRCIERECPEMCKLAKRPPPTSVHHDQDQRSRINALEQLLSHNGIPIPPKHDSHSHSSTLPAHGTAPLPQTGLHRADPSKEPGRDLANILESNSPMASMPSGLGANRTGQGGVEPISLPQEPSAFHESQSFDQTSNFLPDHFHGIPHQSTDNEANRALNFHKESINTDVRNLQNDVDEPSYGTLTISQSGRSKYLGGTAGSEWLKNQQTADADGSPPPISRAASPHHETVLSPAKSHILSSLDGKFAFPFKAGSQTLSTASLLAALPRQSEARALIDSHYRQFAWHFNIAPRRVIDRIVDQAYQAVARGRDATGKDIPAENLALFYIILAMGSYYNLELPADESFVHEFLMLSQYCLAKADFMAKPTLAAVRTLNIMSHVQLSLDAGQDGDAAWPLWGLCTRMATAMGLHRDGRRWNLDGDSVEERRRVFWDIYATDVLTSNCFSRPGTINPAFIDTELPSLSDKPEDLEGFHLAQFRLSCIAVGVLEHSLKVQRPPYAEVQMLHDQICTFERTVDYHLRFRPALCALPSQYPDPEMAIEASPPVMKREPQLTFQQGTLAINISETLIFLHRPYFARALHSSIHDPSRDPYALSYLTVAERCNAIVTIASQLFALYPQAAARHWWIWYHSFNSAACMATLLLRNPQNALSSFALNLLDSTISLYSSVVRNRNSPWMVKNLWWLSRLRQRIGTRMSQSLGEGQSSSFAVPEPEENDVEILGWKTLLIQRGGLGLPKTSIIPSPSGTNPPQHARESSSGGGLPGGWSMSSGQHQPVSSDTVIKETSASVLLSQLWDPLLPGETSSVNDFPNLLDWLNLDTSEQLPMDHA